MKQYFQIALLLISQQLGYAQNPNNFYETLHQKLSEFGNVTMFNPNLFDSLRITLPAEAGERGLVSVDYPSFNQAIEIVSYRAGEKPYDIALHTPGNAQNIEKGLIIVASFYVRCLNSENTGIGKIKSYIETSPQWSEIGSWEGEFDHQWKRVTISGITQTPLTPNQVKLSIHCADRRQALQFGGLTMVLVTPGAIGFDLNKLRKKISEPLYYTGIEENALWRKEAEQRIDKIRKSNLKLEFKKGSKHFENVKVELELANHEFGFGTFLGGLENGINEAWTPQQFNKYLELSKSCFNRFTVPLYFASWSTWGWPEKTFETKYLYALNWAKHTGYNTRGHVTIWPSFQYMPFLEEYARTPLLMDKKIKEHLTYILGHKEIKGFLTDWDIVNEVFTNHDIIDCFPEGQKVITGWYNHARDIDPETNLFINDYGILNQDKKHQDAYFDLINDLTLEGANIDGIGMQGHLHGAIAPETLLKTLDRFAAFNLPIQITEFDFSTDNPDADSLYMRDFLTAMFSHKSVNAVTVWGFWKSAKLNWRPEFYFFDEDFQEQPIAATWRKLAKEVWHTKESAFSNQIGEIHTRGFKGTYDLRVTFKTDTFHLAFQLSDSTNQFVVNKKHIYDIKPGENRLLHPDESGITRVVKIPEDGWYQIGLNARSVNKVPAWYTHNFSLEVDEQTAGILYIDVQGNSLNANILDKPLYLKKGRHTLSIHQKEQLPSPGFTPEPTVQNLFLIHCR